MKEELWESFPPRRDGAMRGMRADGESREQQQQQQWRRWRGRRWRRRRRRCCWGSRSRRRTAREEPAALPEEAAVGKLPRRRQDVPQQEGGVLLAHAVPLQGGLHQQHHLPHVRLQGGCRRGRGRR